MAWLPVSAELRPKSPEVARMAERSVMLVLRFGHSQSTLPASHQQHGISEHLLQRLVGAFAHLHLRLSHTSFRAPGALSGTHFLRNICFGGFTSDGRAVACSKLRIGNTTLLVPARRHHLRMMRVIPESVRSQLLPRKCRSGLDKARELEGLTLSSRCLSCCWLRCFSIVAT